MIHLYLPRKMVGSNSTENKQAPAPAGTATSGSRRSGRGSLFAALFHSRNKTSSATSSAEELPPPLKTKTNGESNGTTDGQGGNLSDADSYEADLNSWIAARAAWWAGSDEGSSDSELELLECQRPAEMVSCSDDTSCSSVELIWSRPKQIQLDPAPPEPPKRPERLEHQKPNNVVGHGFEVLTISQPEHASSKHKQASKALNGRAGNIHAASGLLSPAAAATVIPTAAAPTRTATPSSVSPGSRSPSASAAANNSGGSSTQLFESDTVVRGGVYKPGILQRLSIFELAKPSRAKDKQIGESSRAGRNGGKKGTPVHWVANPLFSDALDDASASSDATGSKERVDSEASSKPTTPSEPTKTKNNNRDGGSNTSEEEKPINVTATSETRTTSPSKTKETEQQQSPNEKPLSVLAKAEEKTNSTSSTDQRPAGDGACAAFALQVVAPTPAELRMRWLACHNNNHKDFSTSTTTTSGAYSSLELEQRDLCRQQQPKIGASRRRASLSFITKACSAREFYGNLLQNANGDDPETRKNTKFAGIRNNKLPSTDDERTDHSETGSSLKKRWSFRARSPFIKSTGDNSSVSGSIYLSHIRQLDQRIKSNVSSIKSQISEKISDTSKRASVLADQLIASIRDTTKEQFAFNSSSHNRHSSSINNNNSYSGSDLECYDNKSVEFDSSSISSSIVRKPVAAHQKDARRARLFSLIYEHQLHQANGQPVITKQPAPAGVTKMLGLKGGLAPNSWSQAAKGDDDYDFADDAADCNILETKATMAAAGNGARLSPIATSITTNGNSINRLAPARPPNPSKAALERAMQRRRYHHTSNHRQQVEEYSRDEHRLAATTASFGPAKQLELDSIPSTTQMAPIALASSSLSLSSDSSGGSSLDSTSSSSSGIPAALRRTQSDGTHDEATDEGSDPIIACDQATRVGRAWRSASGPAASGIFKDSSNSNSNVGGQRTKRRTKRRDRKAFNVAQRRACDDEDDSESDVDNDDEELQKELFRCASDASLSPDARKRYFLKKSLDYWRRRIGKRGRLSSKVTATNIGVASEEAKVKGDCAQSLDGLESTSTSPTTAAI